MIPGDEKNGGGADTVVFSNFADQRLYSQTVSLSDGGEISASAPRALQPDSETKEPSASLLRFADAEPDPLAPQERIFAVLEDHSEAPSPNEPENCLAVVSLETGGIIKIVRGADFYSSPRPSPDGKRIAWVEWVRKMGVFRAFLCGLKEKRGERGKREEGKKRNEEKIN